MNNFLDFAFLVTLGHNFQPCMYYFKGMFSELKANGIEWNTIKILRLMTPRSIVEKCSEVLAKITNQSKRDKTGKGRELHKYNEYNENNKSSENNK